MDRNEINNLLVKARREAEERDARRRAVDCGLEYLDLAAVPVETDALALIPEEKSAQAQAAAIEYKNHSAVLAAYDSRLPAVQALVKELEGRNVKVKVFIVSLSSLERAREFYKFIIPKTGSIGGRIDVDQGRVAALMHKLASLEAVKKEVDSFDFRKFPTSHVLEIILAGGLSSRASDIHFEPGAKEVKLRYRIDGDLHDVMGNLTPVIYAHILSRVKLLSSLKMNIKDAAQDGRMTIGLGKKDIEIRVAVAPSEYGEVMVMRVLDPDAISLSLESLGLRQDDLEIIKEELDRPNGMVLNTGPTGSGKTTTLYAFLKAKSSPEIKIITVEDPIEYHVPGIEQTQVDPVAHYTFENGLKSIMRQDPDAILIGEIRDKETAAIAVQAALTGHLVFSTVHANQAAGAIPRLLDLEVRPSSIGPSLNLIIAQRLVKRLCNACKSKDDTRDTGRLKEFLKKLPSRVRKEEYGVANIYKLAGCEECQHTGYKGRIAIYELLRVSKEIESLMNKQGGEIEIREFALAQGMVTMQQDGILKVLSGITTFEEVKKVTGPIEWS